MTISLDEELLERVRLCKALVVGAGGIGCELVKNLVLAGFKTISLIDLDTIDVSNLNRQFLFQKKHVGRSKAEVAKETADLYDSSVTITTYHDSVFNTQYDVKFFRGFDLVMNALDNKAARNHVNRMCLAADTPLIESGSAGYLGQVTVIKKGVTECYECQPKPAAKTFPGCTIRNTPSEPIHCVVWAKHLFNQLYGEPDADEDVSPDTADPEVAEALTDELPISRISTRDWVTSYDYHPDKLFQKFFTDDINYLLTMDKLWHTRRPPVPLDIHRLPVDDGGNGELQLLPDQRLWSLQTCADTFKQCITSLKEKLNKEGDFLVWDKDHPTSLAFVTCATNLRAHIFGLARLSQFEVKSMAGNIVPAIASTNAVVGGVIVMEALNVISSSIDKCKSTYLRCQPNAQKSVLVRCALVHPNPSCYVCSEQPEVTLKISCKEAMSVETLLEKVLKTQLELAAPDVEIDDGKGTILISSEEGETDDNLTFSLDKFGIRDGSRLKVDDFVHNTKLLINIEYCDLEDSMFEIVRSAKSEQSTGVKRKASEEIAQLSKRVREN
ncbi:SUMO-activating enzyme subunit 2-like [Dysidea avara]|uniref:SUMO-activating enzyme subunit 2-like n=1 Tax=Dysidea avara TaxID=196820 RepID=UPI00332D9FC6